MLCCPRNCVRSSIPPALAVKQATVLKRATAQKNQHGQRARLIQATQAGIIVLAVLVIGWIATRPAQGLPSPAPTPTRSLKIAGPIDYHRAGGLLSGTPAPTPTPDLLHPDVETIVDLARGNHNEWHTLFLDLEVTRYDANGFESMPRSVTRTQAWIDQPSRSRIIYGPMASGPTETYAITDQTVTGQNFRTGETFQMSAQDLITNPDLQRLLIPERMFPSNGNFRLVGRAVRIGKPTWVVDWYSGGIYKTRYWIDAWYGIICAARNLAGMASRTSFLTRSLILSPMMPVFPILSFNSTVIRAIGLQMTSPASLMCLEIRYRCQQ